MLVVDYKDLQIKYKRLGGESHMELVILILALAFIILLIKYLSLKKALEDKALLLFEKWKNEYEEKIRKDAIERSKAVITGKVSEQIAPYLPEFEFNPKDARFIGSPIDFVVFDGLDEGEVRKIVFVEVKAGNSNLSKREKLIKDVVDNKKIEWKLCRIQNDK